MALEYTNWIRSSADMRTVRMGNYNSGYTWEIQQLDGTWIASPYAPEEGNNVWIKHGVIITANAKCKNLSIQIDSSSPNPNYAINFQSFDLQVYGTYTNYSGTEAAPGAPSGTYTGGFTQSYLASGGGITIVGLSRTLVPSTGLSSSLNAGSYYLKINLTNSSQTLTMNSFLVGGETVDIIRGIVNFAGGNTQIRSWRANTPSLLGGDIYIRNGGKVLNPQDLQTSTVGAEARSFTIDSGGLLEFDTTSGNRVKTWRALAYTNNGTIIYSSTVAQTTITPVAGGATLVDNANIVFSGSLAKTLQSNINITTKLSVNGVVTITLNSKTLTYGSVGDLEITATRTRGNELPASGSGVNIPRALSLLASVVYTLGVGTYNIRGTLSTGAGASVVGTLNQSQP